MNLLPSLNPATASVTSCILFAIAVFALVNQLATKESGNKLSGYPALVAAALVGLIVGGFVFGYQHQSHWSANVFGLILEAVQVSAGATMSYALGSVPVQAVSAWGQHHAAQATSTTQAQILKPPTTPA